MSNMNPMLAAIYGTNGATEAAEADLEKSASDEQILDYVVKVAADEGVSMDELSDEDVVALMKMARDHLAGQSGEKTEAADPKGTTEESEASDAGATSEKPEEKTASEGAAEGAAESADEDLEKAAAHADFMGRVMAHAFNQELEAIESVKTATEQETDDPIAVRAYEILEAASAKLESTEEKTASEKAKEVVADALAKEAAETELTAQALSLLEAEGFDVEKITGLLG